MRSRGSKLAAESKQAGGDVMSDQSPMSDTSNSQPAKAAHARISGVWVVVIIGVVVLVLDLVFIIQNSQSVKVSFFTGSVHMPLGVALLLAAVGGLVLAGIVAFLRIWQLRHRARQSS
jgi:uncharacterized integral membrane protein